MVFRFLMVSLLIAFSCCSTEALTWDDHMNFNVKSNQTKIYGTPWDGYEGSVVVGRFFPNIPGSPPDLAICIVDIEGNSQCHHKTMDKKSISFCQNSFDCEFMNILIPKGTFGVLIIDLDLQLHDFVDAVVLSESRVKRDSPDVLKINEHLLNLTNKISPALTEGERLRRTRAFRSLWVKECSEGLACVLQQSQFQIFEE